MPIATDSATTEIIRIKRTVIELTRECGTLTAVTAYQPMGSDKATLDEIQDVIEDHFPPYSTIEAMPLEMEGRIYVMKWRITSE